MKKKRIAIVATALAATLIFASVAYAATAPQSMAEIAASVMGKSVDEVTRQKTNGDVTYGSLARDAGKLEEFQDAKLENTKAILNQRVEAGTITRAQADKTLSALEDNQSSCDGTGSAAIGKGNGGGTGAGNGSGCGSGNCGSGGGRNQGVGAGECPNQ